MFTSILQFCMHLFRFPFSLFFTTLSAALYSDSIAVRLTCGHAMLLVQYLTKVLNVASLTVLSYIMSFPLNLAFTRVICQQCFDSHSFVVRVTNACPACFCPSGLFLELFSSAVSDVFLPSTRILMFNVVLQFFFSYK